MNSQDLYAVLGIVGEETDLFDLLLDLYGEQVVGLFDTEEEQLLIVSDQDELGPVDILTYAHEYLHGLQQQYFDIRSAREELKGNSDRSLAYRALVEGDATIVETVYAFQHLTDEQRDQLRETIDEFPSDALTSAPHLVQRFFYFPYVEGPQFVFNLFISANDWGAVNDAYDELPSSTEQVLHPEKYTSREDPVEVTLPNLTDALGEGWALATEDTLGEFFVRTYLETHIDAEQAALAAEGWGGDGYALMRGPGGQRLVHALISWDSEVDAQEFHDAFLQLMVARSDAQWETLGDDRAGQVMYLQDQSVFVNLESVDTLLVFAPDSTTLARTLLAWEIPGG